MGGGPLLAFSSLFDKSPGASLAAPTTQTPISGVTGETISISDGPIIYAAGAVSANASGLPSPAASTLANGATGLGLNLSSELPLLIGAVLLFMLVKKHFG